jgi:predicted ATPase
VSIRDEKTGIELMPQDVGIGISQTLPVIIGALHIKEGLLTIEQPELHIHPALQVALGDLFISRSRDSQVYFLLETHSEHLMLRFLRRIRETDEGNLPPGKDPLRPDQLAVYYVEQGKTGVSVFPIRISEDGEFIDRWPKGFFSERAEELF